MNDILRSQGSNGVRVEEQEIFELIILDLAVFADIQFLKERLYESLLSRNLQFDEHSVEFFLAQLPILVYIELIEHLL